MKRCTKCKEQKPEMEFYRSKVTSDGLHSWCVACCKAKSKATQHSDISTPRAKSTAFARAYLEKRHIPCCIGRAMGYKFVDLMAWACIPVEAKMAGESDSNKFTWTFTRGQFHKLTGLLLLVADYGNSQRVFIVPVDRVRDSRKTGNARLNSLCVTLDSEHPNSQWNLIKDFEDRIDLIERARLDYMRGTVAPACTGGIYGVSI